MSRGTPDDELSNLAGSENDKSATQKDGVAEKSEAFSENTDPFMENLCTRFAERVLFSDGHIDKFVDLMMEKIGVEDLDRGKRVAAARASEESKKKRFRSELMDKDIINALNVVSVVEQFVEQYQDSLEYLRKMFPANGDAAPPLPPPIALRSMMPPPVIDVTSAEFHEVTRKRVEELKAFHRQQADEVNQISDYHTMVLDNKPTWCSEYIGTLLFVFQYEILCAEEFYTEELGESPYSDSTHEEFVQQRQFLREQVVELICELRPLNIK